MTVTELVERLQELKDQGFGDQQVGVWDDKGLITSNVFLSTWQGYLLIDDEADL